MSIYLLRFYKAIKICVVFVNHIALVIEDKRELGDYRDQATNCDRGIQYYAENALTFGFANRIQQQICPQYAENKHYICRIAQMHTAIAQVEEGKENRA